MVPLNRVGITRIVLKPNEQTLVNHPSENESKIKITMPIPYFSSGNEDTNTFHITLLDHPFKKLHFLTKILKGDI